MLATQLCHQLHGAGDLLRLMGGHAAGAEDAAATRDSGENDSVGVDAAGQKVLEANADVLKRYPSWQISIEGHCDERGTAEYNLALGERRALAARNYLVSLGVTADRVKTVSYGKEFPFDPGHTESAWAKNRRAHFVVTAK